MVKPFYQVNVCTRHLSTRIGGPSPFTEMLIKLTTLHALRKGLTVKSCVYRSDHNFLTIVFEPTQSVQKYEEAFCQAAIASHSYLSFCACKAVLFYTYLKTMFIVFKETRRWPFDADIGRFPSQTV